MLPNDAIELLGNLGSLGGLAFAVYVAGGGARAAARWLRARRAARHAAARRSSEPANRAPELEDTTPTGRVRPRRQTRL